MSVRIPGSSRGSTSSSPGSKLPASVPSTNSAFKTYYVIPGTGSDSNDGLSTGKAFATLTHAVTVAQGAGGGDLRLGPGSHPVTSNAMVSFQSNNLRITGVPGLTTVVVSGSDGRVGLGLDSTTTSGTSWTNFSLSNLTFDFSATAGGGVVIGAVSDWLLDNVTIKTGVGPGAGFPLTLGGDLLPATRGAVRNLRILVSSAAATGFAIAPVNVDQVEIDGWWLIGPANANTQLHAIDCETNTETDYLRGLKFKNGFVVRMPGIALSNGATTDENRMGGLEYVGNTHIDSEGILCGVRGAKITHNTLVYTQRGNPITGVPGRGISLRRGGNYGLAPDGCVVEDNTLIDMVQNGGEALSIEASHTSVARNRVIARRAGTDWAVLERQVAGCVLSGLVAGTPSSMTIPLTAGVVQDDIGGVTGGAGGVHSVSAGNATITAASAYDRIDLIQIRPDTQAISVKKGLQPSFGLPPGPPVADYTLPTFACVPLYQVYVPASASSILASDVRDVRPFPPGHNRIEQQAPTPAVRYGTAGQSLSPTSVRVARDRPSYATYSTADQKYIAQALSLSSLLGHWPMLESSGMIAADLGPYGNEGVYAGGVLLNQQMGATGRFGAKFDGSSGYMQITRIPELWLEGPMTICAIIYGNTGEGVIIDQQQSTRLWGGVTGLLWQAGGNSVGVASTTTASAATRTHVAMDWNGTNLNFYFNGTLDGGGTQTPTAPTFAANATYDQFPINVGASTAAVMPPSQFWFNGFITHLSLFGSSLGGTAVSALAALR